ncbi:MAG: dUTP diphosphatase [Sulfurimonas sp.]|nr:dUTP diphosphatase [Sulfurimonas sp.]
MENIQKLQRMLDLQQKLNDETNGLDWEKGITKNGKIINWHRCIYMEAVEFIDSFPWKHWKNIDAEPNIENAKIELVDIWHFLLSEMLRVDYQKRIDNLYKHVIAVSYSQYSYDEKHENTIKMAEEMLNEATKNCPKINAIVSQFFNTCALIGLSFDELYIKYLGKNILNKFRQDNGYKDGTYIKIWNEKEDNEVMLEIIQSNPNLSSDEILNRLQQEYPNGNT